MPKNVFTVAQIACVLQRSKRSVLQSLRHTPPSETKIVHGNEARGWLKDALPKTILATLEDIAARRKLSVDALFASPAPLWRPRCPLSELCQEAMERASLLLRALAPSMARQNDVGITSTQLERLGVEDYRRTFGYSVSRRHWRRLFRRTLGRDGGVENWGRLENYLDESPARKPELRKRILYTPIALKPLQELIASFENPAEPTDLQRVVYGSTPSNISSVKSNEVENQKQSSVQRSSFSTRTHRFSENRRKESNSSSIEN